MKAQQQLHAGHYFGQVAQRLETGGIILTTSDYRQHTQLPAHYHENAYFCLVSEGHYTEDTAAQTLDCSTADVIYHPAGITHSNTFPHARAICFNVEISQTWWQRLEQRVQMPGRIAKVNSRDLQTVLHKLRRECEQADAASPLLVEGLVMEGLALYLRAKSNGTQRAPNWLKQVRDYLHAAYLQPISLTQVADAARVSPYHLAHTFKKVYGLSMGDYVNELRIAHGADLLLAGNLPLAHIALECGFADQSHFGRMFKRVKGVSPAAYRKGA